MYFCLVHPETLDLDWNLDAGLGEHQPGVGKEGLAAAHACS